MYKQLQHRLAGLDNLPRGSLTEGRQLGVEKETLRVQSNGAIAQTPHPPAFGAALSNPWITTDYSESLLELVTPPLDNAQSALQFLEAAHRFIYPRLPSGETLWATSMPCILGGSESIPVGRYGSSNAGMMKHVYRKGLGLRYGKAMQTIAGVHFYFSWPKSFWPLYQALLENQNGSTDIVAEEFITEQYFHMTRNLLRYGWLVPYLFGASPAICKTFLGGADPLAGMDVYNHHTYYEPCATSLRMGDIGYQYSKDSATPIQVSYCSMDVYIRDLLKLVSTVDERYAGIGVLDANGQHQQLNVNRLQIENEYYSSVRPKQIARNNQMPLLAMAEQGIRYLELRSIDVNAFEPLGIELSQLHFLELFMLFSLLQESPCFSDGDIQVVSDNMSKTAHRGREPGLKLRRTSDQHKPVRLDQWGKELLDQMQGPASMLDHHSGTRDYSRALALQLEKLDNPELTPSARVLDTMMDNYSSFSEFAMAQSMQYADRFSNDPPASSAVDDNLFLKAAAESQVKQESMEANSSGSFAEYIGDYLKQLDDPLLDSFRSYD